MVPSYSRRGAAAHPCHRNGAAAPRAAAATSPFCSQQQQQSLCFPSLAIIEARGSLLLTCSYHRGSHRHGVAAAATAATSPGVAKEAAFIAAGRKKARRAPTTNRADVAEATVVCSVQAACKPAGRSRRWRAVAGVASRRGPLGVADGGGRDGARRSACAF